MSGSLADLSRALGGPTSQVGGLTQARVMRAIAQRGGSAVQRDIAESLRLSAGTVSKAVTHLRDQGMVEDAETAPTGRGRGRPTVPVQWSSGNVSIGVRIIDRDGRPTELAGTVVDLSGRPPAGWEKPRRHRLKREAGNAGKRLLDEIAGFVRKLAAEVAKTPGGATVLGCGVSMGGHVDHGVIRLSYNTGWGVHEDWWAEHDEFDLRKQLDEALPFPVVLDNDVNALAVRLNLTSRPAETYGTVAVLRDGIGAALVIGGDMWRGHGGLVGEIGHLPIGGMQTSGRDSSRSAVPVCRCGEAGHVEAFASPRAILARANTADLDQLAARPPRDSAVADLFEQGGRALGRGIVTMINWVNPELVFLYAPPELVSDDPSKAGSRYREAIRDEVARAFSTGRETRLEIIPTTEGEIEDLGAESSAFLVLGRLIDMVAVQQ